MRIVGGDALAEDPPLIAAERERADELDRIVAEWIAARPLAEVEASFLERDAAGIRVIDMADAAEDPHWAARGTVVAVPDDELGEVLMTGPVPRMSATPGRIAHAGRALGADDDAPLGRAGGAR